MRIPGKYNAPRFMDPNDKRLVQIIKQSRNPQPKSVNFLGIPFDGAVLGRKGAAEGPAAVRHALSGFSNYNVELGVGLQGARLFDLGDLKVDRRDLLAAHAEIEREVHADLGSDSLLVVVGGDNSLSLPSIRAFRRKFGQIGLIVIDSHLDLRGEIGGRPTSGSSYGLAIKEGGGLIPGRVVEIGVHGFLNSVAYVKKAERLGLSVITAVEVKRRGAQAVAKEAIARASEGAKAVYLSVDMDAVDSGQVSGVSAPSPGGVSSSELFELLYPLANEATVKCADLAELAPSLDPTGRSQVVAATALVYMFAGFHRRRKRS